jgi:oligopeptide transport system permease protein
MTKYLLGRILRSLVSVFIVVGVIMVTIYSFLDKKAVFASDPSFTKVTANSREEYMMKQWENYGYLDFIPYADYLTEELKAGNINQETYDEAVKLGKTAKSDSDITKEYTQKFIDKYEKEGYKVVRLKGITRPNSKRYKEGGKPMLYVYKDIPVTTRLVKYFTNLFSIDNIHKAENVEGERGLKFVLRDPAYGGEKISPAIMGNGTNHKYLLYFDDNFPYIHQNLLSINLGKSFSVNKGIEVFETMTQAQGALEYSTVTYPTGVVEETADDLHTATYVAGSREMSELNQRYYVDDYTSVTTAKDGMSQMGIPS